MIWSFLLSLFQSSLTQITRDLTNAYEAKLKAQTDAEKLAADERISVLEARRQIILSAQSDPFERWVRIGFALPFVVYINKLVLWDKVLEWGITDPLSEELSYVMMIVLGGYFVDFITKKFKR